MPPSSATSTVLAVLCPTTPTVQTPELTCQPLAGWFPRNVLAWLPRVDPLPSLTYCECTGLPASARFMPCLHDYAVLTSIPHLGSHSMPSSAQCSHLAHAGALGIFQREVKGGHARMSLGMPSLGSSVVLTVMPHIYRAILIPRSTKLPLLSRCSSQAGPMARRIVHPRHCPASLALHMHLKQGPENCSRAHPTPALLTPLRSLSSAARRGVGPGACSSSPPPLLPQSRGVGRT